MKNSQLKKLYFSAFTLVELIVVIVILTILATIAFLSFNSYSTSSRDSVRLADINGVRKSLELYYMNSWKYPVPSSPTHTVTYSWWLLFTEWTLWDSVFKILSNISKKTIDPKVWVEYTYSVSNSNREYSIWTMSERNSSSYIPANNFWDLFTNKSFAANTTNTAIVSGNYNWVLSPLVNTGSMYYYMALPTIITSDTRTGNLEITAISTWAFVYDNMRNLPFTYQWWTTSSTWTFTYNPPIVYSWTTVPRTSNDISTLVTNLKTAYSWSALQNQPEIAKIIVATPQELVNQTVSLINTNWWTAINATNIDPYASYNTLLLHFDWSLGNSWSNVWIITNNWSTTFNSAWKIWNSAYFNWINNYLTIPNSTSWNFWTSDFTIDFWYKINVEQSSMFIWKQRSWTYEWFVCYYWGGTIFFDATTNWTSWNLRLSKAVWVDNNWHHYAIIRIGTTYKLYFDWVMVASWVQTWSIINNTNNLVIWRYEATLYPLNWFLDDVRITKWVARWNLDFTPPTTSY